MVAEPAEAGELVLKVTPLFNSLAMSSVAMMAPVKPATEKYVPTMIPEVVEAQLPVSPLEASHQYLAEVQSLLESKDIAGAMALRQNVKTLHSQLQKEFAKLYGQDTQTLKVPAIDQDVSAEQLLESTFNSHMVAYLKAGNAQQALGLIDQLDNLTSHVDAKF